jgi:predicted ATPase
MGEIRSIRIQRFKALSDVSVNLEDANLLVGGNNSGKTSVLQALHFAIAVAQSAKLARGGTWRGDTCDVTFRPEQLIYSPTTDFTALGYGRPLGERRDSCIEVEIQRQEGQRCSISVMRGRNGNVSLHMEGRELGERIQDISQPYTVYAPGLAGIAREETKLSQGVILRAVARGDANLVFRNVLFWLSLLSPEDPRVGEPEMAGEPTTDASASRWEQFRNDITELFPGLELRVGFFDLTDEHIQVTFQLGNDQWLPIDSAGLGILQAAQVLAYVALFKPRLLLLDEPDSHMHPNNQAAICNLLMRLAKERNFQVILASHSRHVINAMREQASVRWISQGSVEELQTEITARLLELGALDFLDYLGHPYLRCVVLTEDSRTTFLRSVLEASHFNLEETQILAYEGVTKIDAALLVGRLLRDRAPNIRVIVHRDRDYLPGPHVDQYTDRIEALGCSAFITDASDLEGYFLSAEHINSLYPQIDVRRAHELLQEATDLTRDASIRKMINLRTEHAGRGADYGEIALAAQRDYDANTDLLRRGKKVLPRLKFLLQQELGMNVRLDQTSRALAVPTLSIIAGEMWPQGV